MIQRMQLVMAWPISAIRRGIELTLRFDGMLVNSQVQESMFLDNSVPQWLTDLNLLWGVGFPTK